MGYLSDVAYVIEFNSIEDRDAFVTLQLASDNKYVRDAINECKTDYKKKPWITFTASDVKWYPSHPDVIPHDGFGPQAVELYDASYRFIRVGEADDDIAKRSDGEADLWEVLDTRVEWIRDFDEGEET